MNRVASKIVYILTEGSYSDYCIRAVFSTKEKALAAIALFGGVLDESDIEEWVMDAIPEDGRKPYFVRLSADGYMTEIQVVSSMFMMKGGSRCNLVPGGPYAGQYNCWAYARDEAHAVKVAAEKRREMIALG